jgi:hypothetical protein
MLANDGLFTAYHGERGWGIAHRILMPAFGPLRIRDMFEDMSDVAQQLCFKWYGSLNIGFKNRVKRTRKADRGGLIAVDAGPARGVRPVSISAMTLHASH